MDFRAFAENHGLVINRLFDDGQIHAVRTTDKPKKRNGRYKFDPISGRGWVQNWAIHSEVIGFAPENSQPLSRTSEQQLAIRSRAVAAQKYEQTLQLASAEMAQTVIKECEFDIHAYLVGKGFPKLKGLVDRSGKLMRKATKFAGQLVGPDWQTDEDLLVIPVRAYDNYQWVQSIQFVNRAGNKLFLRNGRMKGGCLRLGAADSKAAWFCEGYSTGLTVQAALAAANKLAAVYICFSAANMQRIAHAAIIKDKFIFADHDKVNPQTGTRAGEQAAQATGLPWCQSTIEGFDANDLHMRDGVYAVVSLMRAIMR